MVGFLAVLVLLLFACGGGDKPQEELSFSLSHRSLEGRLNDNLEVLLTISLSSSDTIPSKVEFKSVVLLYEGEERREVIPLGFFIEGRGSREVKLTLYSSADRSLVPYAYLHPQNPSSVFMVSRNQVLARPTSVEIGVGDGVSKEFSLSFTEPISVGTCKVLAGNLELEETSLGVLTGAGVGVVGENFVSISFSSAVPLGMKVLLVCLSRMEVLERAFYEFTDLKFSYGDRIYDVVGGLIFDGDVVIGRVELGRVVLLSSIGFQDAPFVANYRVPEGGGELAGVGNGGRSYSLRTRYAPLKEDSVKAYARVEDRFVICAVESVESSGRVNVHCPVDVPTGSPIYVEYTLKEVLQKVKVYVETDRGMHHVGEVLLRVKP